MSDWSTLSSQYKKYRVLQFEISYYGPNVKAQHSVWPKTHEHLPTLDFFYLFDLLSEYLGKTNGNTKRR